MVVGHGVRETGIFDDIACVAVVETSATQGYIFSSNRQAEDIGETLPDL